MDPVHVGDAAVIGSNVSQADPEFNETPEDQPQKCHQIQTNTNTNRQVGKVEVPQKYRLAGAGDTPHAMPATALPIASLEMEQAQQEPTGQLLGLGSLLSHLYCAAHGAAEIADQHLLDGDGHDAGAGGGGAAAAASDRSAASICEAADDVCFYAAA